MKVKLLAGLLIAGMWLGGCTPQWMFQHREGFDPSKHQAPLAEAYEHVLEPDDKITVSVWGHDELGVGSSFSVYDANLESGHFLTIDLRGEITLPLIGRVKIAGLTCRESDLYLGQLYTQYVKNPIVRLRVLNHTVTVLGEVKSPGNYPIERQRQTLIETLGDAGGFTDYADKGELLILRPDSLGRYSEIRVDLTDAYTLYAQDLSLRPRDVIYVPERRSKQFDKFNSSLAPFAGFAGTAILLITILRQNSN